MAAPTIAATLKVSAPSFIRKLRRATDWEQAGDDDAAKALAATNQVFGNSVEPEISIYLVKTDEDFRRVAIGMNANRDSLTESINFLAFSQDELTAAGIAKPAQTPGDLKCDYANALHFDKSATAAQLEQLCTNLMARRRAAARCTKGAMKDAERLTIAEQCKSAPGVTTCGVPNCSPGVAGR